MKKSAGVAALLSFIFPGLGHLYLGRRRQAVVFAIPALVLAVAVGLTLLVSVDGAIASLISPSGSLTALLLVVLAAGWRLIAVIDSALIARREYGMGIGSAVAVVAMVLVVLGTHGGPAYIAYSVYDASSRIFVGAGPDSPGTAVATPPGSGSVPTAVGSESDDPNLSDGGDDPNDYLATPLAEPETAKSRINILLTGIDSAANRSTALTDTLLVLSINPEDNSVQLVSLPRDISDFPLYNGGTYTGKINSLMSWAKHHKNDFPDGPFPTLIKQVGYLLGIPIHYFAAVDLQGFRRMVDAVGGITVDNPKAINDPRYDWLDGTHGFQLPAGKVKLDGRKALAYARSRQGAGDSDFTRAARQQQLLIALRKKLASPDMVTEIPNLLEIAGDTVRTSIPTNRFEELIGLARTIDTDKIQRQVVTYPITYHPPTSSTGGVWKLRLHMDKMAELSKKLFGDDSRYANE